MVWSPCRILGLAPAQTGLIPASGFNSSSPTPSSWSQGVLGWYGSRGLVPGFTYDVGLFKNVSDVRTGRSAFRVQRRRKFSAAWCNTQRQTQSPWYPSLRTSQPLFCGVYVPLVVVVSIRPQQSLPQTMVPRSKVLQSTPIIRIRRKEGAGLELRCPVDMQHRHGSSLKEPMFLLGTPEQTCAQSIGILHDRA
jgi:hypothetical protein